MNSAASVDDYLFVCVQVRTKKHKRAGGMKGQTDRRIEKRREGRGEMRREDRSDERREAEFGLTDSYNAKDITN